MNYWQPLGDMMIGGIATWSVLQLWYHRRLFRVRMMILKMFSLPVPAETGRFAFFRRLYRAIFASPPPWWVRIAPFFGIFTVASSAAQHGFFDWYTLMMFVVWFLTVNMYTYLASVTGFNAGWLAGSSREASEAVARTIVEAFQTRDVVAAVDVSDLLNLADEYKIPPQKVHDLLWSDKI